MKKWPYISIMFGLSVFYIFLQYKFQCELISRTIEVVLLIIAGVAFWLELRRGDILNEAKFIMDLNNQFICSPELTEIEYMLEQYYKNYSLNNKDVLTLDENFDINSEQRQYLINYLVHLEEIATLVNRGVLHLNVIDDLMAYRYFIAVNNPIVQNEELLKYKDFYKGCISIYDKWAKVLDDKDIDIPMNDNAFGDKI